MGTAATKHHPLIRTIDLVPEVRSAGGGDKMTLVGYAAVFGERTSINSWEGRFDEVIARGAFDKTLREQKPVVQFDHGRDPAIGALPIGSLDVAREDDHGLYVEVGLHDNDHVRPVRDAVASGALSGMSFQFRVLRDDFDETGDVPLRTVREVQLFELGPVVFPAYPTTEVGLRSMFEQLPPDRAAELLSYLQEQAGAAPQGTPESSDTSAARSGTPVNLNNTAARLRAYLATK